MAVLKFWGGWNVWFYKLLLWLYEVLSFQVVILVSSVFSAHTAFEISTQFILLFHWEGIISQNQETNLIKLFVYSVIIGNKYK